MVNNIHLICKSLWYYSMADEALFFEWLKKIPSIASIGGKGDELYIRFSTLDIPEQDLIELLALFYRYKVPMTQFAQFLTPENKSWFYDNKKAFWHRRVFGAALSKNKK